MGVRVSQLLMVGWLRLRQARAQVGGLALEKNEWVEGCPMCVRVRVRACVRACVCARARG